MGIAWGNALSVFCRGLNRVSILDQWPRWARHGGGRRAVWRVGEAILVRDGRYGTRECRLRRLACWRSYSRVSPTRHARGRPMRRLVGRDLSGGSTSPQLRTQEAIEVLAAGDLSGGSTSPPTLCRRQGPGGRGDLSGGVDVAAATRAREGGKEKQGESEREREWGGGQRQRQRGGRHAHTHKLSLSLLSLSLSPLFSLSFFAGDDQQPPGRHLGPPVTRAHTHAYVGRLARTHIHTHTHITQKCTSKRVF